MFRISLLFRKRKFSFRANEREEEEEEEDGKRIKGRGREERKEKEGNIKRGVGGRKKEGRSILIHRLRGSRLVDAAKEGSRDTIPVVIKLAKSLPNSRRGSAPRVSF